MSADTYYKSHR